MTRYACTAAHEVATKGFAHLRAADYPPIDCGGPELRALGDRWDELELDEALVDGGAYRYRRYGRLVARRGDDGGVHLAPLPHAAFRQEAVPMWRGRSRVFAPIAAETLRTPCLHVLIRSDLDIAATFEPAQEWEVGLHMVRIVARPGEPGQPTPEGLHQDGHAFVGMHLLRREGCVGGESIIRRDGEPSTRLLLTEPLDSLVVDDRAVWHQVLPVAVAPGADGVGTRDILLVDLNPR